MIKRPEASWASGVGIQGIIAVQRVRFPGRVRAQIGGVVFQIGEQNFGEKLAQVVALNVGTQHAVSLPSGAGRINVVLQGSFHRGGPVKKQVIPTL